MHYVSPELKIFKFSVADVLTTSQTEEPLNSNSWEDPEGIDFAQF